MFGVTTRNLSSVMSSRVDGSGTRSFRRGTSRHARDGSCTRSSWEVKVHTKVVELDGSVARVFGDSSGTRFVAVRVIVRGT